MLNSNVSISEITQPVRFFSYPTQDVSFLGLQHIRKILRGIMSWRQHHIKWILSLWCQFDHLNLSPSMKSSRRANALLFKRIKALPSTFPRTNNAVLLTFHDQPSYFFLSINAQQSYIHCWDHQILHIQLKSLNDQSTRGT